MSLYSILLSTMFPNNTPPLNHGFSDPHSQHSSTPDYNDAMLSDDLSQVGFGSAIDPYTNLPSPSSSSSHYPNPSLTPLWPQGYSQYGSGTHPAQLVQSSGMPAHSWQPSGYPQAQPEGPQLYDQGFGPGMHPHQLLSLRDTQLTTHFVEYGGNGSLWEYCGVALPQPRTGGRHWAAAFFELPNDTDHPSQAEKPHR
ncbi:hypothetical protein FOMPIDRAFT_1018846 [Fomitopsis schrenkii]|uniref:Uncharacterized protein n=1 Tax=Fomitopsis schrenkii TaxID=2126942 RepID=S8DZB8_FOMSC|nr:hypothetical protein FOMPIDRAFT_1018846 [Fomitopsis schrenkii]